MTAQRPKAADECLSEWLTGYGIDPEQVIQIARAEAAS